MIQTTNEGHAVMNNSYSSSPNGTISYRAIVKDPREDNSIEITTAGNNIYFYAPPTGCCSGGSGGTEEPPYP
jgi:hypothetical protein